MTNINRNTEVTGVNVTHVQIQERHDSNVLILKQLERRMQTCALRIGRDQFATLADISYSYASEICDAKKTFPLKLVPVLLLHDPEGFIRDVMSLLCEILDLNVPTKKRPLTSEEELNILKSIIKDMGLQDSINAEKRPRRQN